MTARARAVDHTGTFARGQRFDRLRVVYVSRHHGREELDGPAVVTRVMPGIAVFAKWQGDGETGERGFLAGEVVIAERAKGDRRW